MKEFVQKVAAATGNARSPNSWLNDWGGNFACRRPKPVAHFWFSRLEAGAWESKQWRGQDLMREGHEIKRK